MADVIDEFKVQIDASTNSTDAKIDKFIQKMKSLQSAISGIEMSGASQVASGINQISSAIQRFSAETKTTDFSRITRGLNKLGEVNVQGVSDAARAMSTLSANLSSMGNISYDGQGIINLASSISKLGGKTVTQAVANIPLLKNSLQQFIQTMNGMQSVTFDPTGLQTLVSSITKLGGKAAGNAIPNIQNLGTALSNLMTTLASAPTVNQNLIQMTNALASLASNGSRVATASRSMTSSFNAYSYSANRAKKSTKGLVSQIGMFYAKCFLLVRGVKSLWKATESSMDYIETLNYFDSAWGQVAENAIGSWKDSGYESANAYADSFSRRARELTGKMSGFQADAQGNLVSTGMPSLGLNPETTMNYQATFGQMASSMGVASETALKLSNALTMIGADLASVKNLEFETVWDDMASGMVGMSRTLDKYGVNIRNVNLQQKLTELGINANVSALNQQDKALLRVIILLQSTKYAWGDLATTITQPANQLRLLQANFANLARTIGNILLPIVSKVLPYINALIIAIQRLFSWLGGLIGINISGLSSSIGSAAVDMGDFEDAAGGAADNLGSAADNAKKMAGNLQAFDKLNVITSQDDSSGGGSGGSGGGGVSGLLDDAFLDAFAEYQATWDAAFAGLENTAQEMADKITDAFRKIWETAEPTREALKRLWDEGLAQLGTFTWTALKDFWNEFLVPMGKWTLGTGLPMLIDNINAFLLKIDFPAINTALKNFWQALEPFAEKVGEGLINFFGDLLSFGASFINATVPSGLNAIAEAIRKIDPDTAEKIGYALGIVATGIMAFKALSPMVKILESVATSMKKWDNLKSTFKFLGAVKYVAIAAGVVGLVVALDKFGAIDVDWSKFANGFKSLASALGRFVSGIGQGLISFIKGITPILSPSIETVVNGFGTAFEFLAKVLDAIPESVISGLTQAFSTFFVAFKTYEFVIKTGGLLSAFAGNIKLFASVLPGIVNSGPIILNLAAALGPTALGGIAFTAIAGGLFLLATHMNNVTTEAAKNSAIGKFASAIGELNDEVSEKTEEINSNLDKTQDAIQTAGVAETQIAKDLAEEYGTLSDKLDLNIVDKKRLVEVSEELVEIIPGLSKYIDEETGCLDIQKGTLDAVISGYESLAQKQAAQEYLVQAYKDQYEAQMNVKNAQDEYNKAFDEYIANAELAPDIIEKIKEGTFELSDAYADFGYTYKGYKGAVLSSAELVEKYGTSKFGVFSKAVTGLNTEMAEYSVILSEAEDAQVRAGETLGFLHNTIDVADKKLQEATETELAGRLASDEYKQSISDLSTEFSNLDISISDELMQNLALDGFDASILSSFFESLADGVSASSSDLQDAFSNLGLKLPDELAKALSSKTSTVQAESVRLLLSIQSGVRANEEQLKTLFTNLGINLPDCLINNLLLKESDIQTTTIDLLSKIENGYKLTEGRLISLFSALGLTLPQTLIASLADGDAEVQAQAIQLLGQLSAAEESERPGLIEKFNDLGVGIADDGVIKGMTDKTSDTVSATNTFLNDGVKSPIELAEDAISKLSWDNGKAVVDGTNSGIEDNQSSTKGVISTWISNITGWFKDMLGIHSPSTVFAGYGLFTVEGYDEGLSDNMKSSVDLMKDWAADLANAFDAPNLAIPDMGVTYSVNRELLDRIDAQATLSFDNSQYDFKTDISAELSGAFANLIDYDKLGIAVYQAQSKALQENPVTIGDKDVFESTRRGQSSFYRKTGTVGLAGV